MMNIRGPPRTSFERRAYEFIINSVYFEHHQLLYLADGVVSLAPDRREQLLVYDPTNWRSHQTTIVDTVREIGVIRVDERIATGSHVAPRRHLIRRALSVP